MKKRAVILDLDNTVYPVIAIGEALFAPLVALIQEQGAYRGDIKDIKKALMKKPFQVVAKEHSFSEELMLKSLTLLSELSWNAPMQTFNDYKALQKLGCQKFLVTTGFSKLQNSKVKQLGIKDDFDDIFIVDPSLSSLTKKDVFKKILDDYSLANAEVIVVGDDLDSEIKAAQDLGIEAILYDPDDLHKNASEVRRISTFWDLQI